MMSHMNVSPMGFSCGEDDCENIAGEVPYLIDDEESQEIRQEVRRGWSMEEVHHHQHQSFQNDMEFGPVEHPMEPRDEDRPVRCPMPAASSSVLNKNGRIHGRRSFDSSMRRRAELLPAIMNTQGTVVVATASEAPVRSVRKRHHTPTRGEHAATPPPPSLPTTQNITIFQMLQQFDKF